MVDEAGAEFLAWLEHNDWSELEPGEPVIYKGGLIAAHGLWVVHARVDDERYTLRHPDNEWERLNADRSDVTPVDKGEEAQC